MSNESRVTRSRRMVREPPDFQEGDYVILQGNREDVWIIESIRPGNKFWWVMARKLAERHESSADFSHLVRIIPGPAEAALLEQVIELPNTREWKTVLLLARAQDQHPQDTEENSMLAEVREAWMTEALCSTGESVLRRNSTTQESTLPPLLPSERVLSDETLAFMEEVTGYTTRQPEIGDCISWNSTAVGQGVVVRVDKGCVYAKTPKQMNGEEEGWYYIPTHLIIQK